MSTPSQPGPLTSVPGAPVEFSDGNGERWRVTERDCRQVPGARGVRCLIFQSDSTFRRVWNYPADWRVLGAAALMEVSWRR